MGTQNIMYMEFLCCSEYYALKLMHKRQLWQYEKKLEKRNCSLRIHRSFITHNTKNKTHGNWDRVGVYSVQLRRRCL